MGNASSRARAVYKQNTAVAYCEPSDAPENTPVSTARVVAVGGTNAARGGGTLQLVGGVAPSEHAAVYVDERNWSVSLQPQVVAVEPPRAAARKRPPEKRPTRVIAYNVRIVAQEDAAGVDEAQPYVEAQSDEQDSEPMAPNHARAAAQHTMPNHARAGIHNGGVHRSQNPVDAQFVTPRHAHAAPGSARFEQAQFPMPSRAPRDERLDMPNRMPPQRHMQNGRDGMPLEVPAGAAGPIPMSLFGALENMGGALHEQARRAQAPATAAYKQLLAQQLEARHGGLFSNRNLCLAVGAYAFVLFLLAFFG